MQSKDDGSFLDVALEIVNAAKRTIKVATLAILKSVDSSNQTCKVMPFPISTGTQEKLITVRYLNADSQNELENELGKTVLVLFLDKDFRKNFNYQLKGKSDILQVNDDNLHTEDFGIIIKTF